MGIFMFLVNLVKRTTRASLFFQRLHCCLDLTVGELFKKVNDEPNECMLCVANIKIYLKFYFFESGAMPILTKSRNSTILVQKGRISTK